MTFSRKADPNLHDRQMHSWAMWVMGRPTCTSQAPGFPVGLPRWSLSSELNGGAAYSNYITCQPAAPSYCLLKINAFSPTPKLHHSRHLTGFVQQQWQGQQLSCSTEWLKTQWHFTYKMTRVRRVEQQDALLLSEQNAKSTYFTKFITIIKNLMTII